MCVCVCVFALLTNQCVGSPAKKISPELKRQVSPCSLPLTPFGMCPRDSYRRCHQGAGVCDGVTEGFVNGASLRVEAEPCWCKGGGIQSEKKGYLWQRVVKFLGVSFRVSWAPLSPSLLLSLSVPLYRISPLFYFSELEAILLSIPFFVEAWIWDEGSQKSTCHFTGRKRNAS